MNTTCEIHDAAATKGESERGGARPMLRLAIVLVGFILCCFVAFHVGAFIAATRGAGRHAADRTSAAQLDPLASMMPFADQWAFDELDWSVKSQQVDTQQLYAEFESQVASQPSTAELPDADAEIIGLMAALQIRPTEKLGKQVYRIDRPDLRVQLITRELDGKAKAVGFAMAFPQGDRWQLFAFLPRDSETVASTSADAHLLPLPADAHRSGGRFDDAGRPLVEFISLASNADALAAEWQAAGWEVRPSGLADSADFSVLCARGEETVYAWSADSPGDLKNLMLVRTPTPADTSP